MISISPDLYPSQIITFSEPVRAYFKRVIPIGFSMTYETDPTGVLDRCVTMASPTEKSAYKKAIIRFENDERFDAAERFVIGFCTLSSEGALEPEIEAWCEAVLHLEDLGLPTAHFTAGFADLIKPRIYDLIDSKTIIDFYTASAVELIKNGEPIDNLMGNIFKVIENPELTIKERRDAIKQISRKITLPLGRTFETEGEKDIKSVTNFLLFALSKAGFFIASIFW